MTRLDAAAAAICERRNAPDWPCNGLDFDVELARVALVAAQLADCPDPQSDIERYRAQMAPVIARLAEVEKQNEERGHWLFQMYGEIERLNAGLSQDNVGAFMKTLGQIPPSSAQFGAKEPAEELAEVRAELANARGWLLWIEQTHPGLTAMWRKGDPAP